MDSTITSRTLQVNTLSLALAFAFAITHSLPHSLNLAFAFTLHSTLFPFSSLSHILFSPLSLSSSHSSQSSSSSSASSSSSPSTSASSPSPSSSPTTSPSASPSHSTSLSNNFALSIYKQSTENFAISLYQECSSINEKNIPQTPQTPQSPLPPQTARNLLKVFGMNFTLEGSTYVLMVERYSVPELLNMNDNILKVYNEPNKSGFVALDHPRNPVCYLLEQHLESLGFEIGDKRVGSNQNTFLMWYNFINLHLYYLTVETMRTMQDAQLDEIGCKNEDEQLERFSDLVTLSTTLLSRLDPYLRFQIQKRGVTIIQNTYCGYDSEYESKNYKKHLNRLVSVQTALQTRTLVKIPLYKQLDISYMHPLTSEISTLYRPKVEDLNSEFASDSDSSNSNELFEG